MQKIVLFVAAFSLSQIPGCEKENAYVAPPPPGVSVATPIEQTVTEYLEFTGTTDSSAFVEVRARVPGILETVNFEPGSIVQQGDILFQIDPSEYEANLSGAQADLKVAEAELEQATTELERNERLQKKGAVAEVKVVEWRTKKSVARAAKQQGEAKVERARLDLTYTKIEAPITGRVSRNLVDPGNLVGEGEATLLTAITAYDPMYVYFNLNELDLLRVMNGYRAKLEAMNISPDEEVLDRAEVPLFMGLADEEGYPHEGLVDYSESGVNPETGTIQLRGTFANPGRPPKLLPGLFARIRMPVREQEGALLVTERAVGADQGGRYLLVVNDQNEVEKRPVRTGQNVDGLLVIEEGLNPGERVVVNGIQRARPGAPVEPEEIDMASFKTSVMRAAAEAAMDAPESASEEDQEESSGGDGSTEGQSDTAAAVEEDKTEPAAAQE